MTKTRVPRTATVIESKLKKDSAQIIVDKGIFMANQQGSGIVIDENVIEVGAENIRLTSTKEIEINGSPLNPRLMNSEKFSQEMVKANRLNCYAGEVIYAAPIAHTHRYPVIQVPPVYKSNMLQTLKKMEKAAGVVGAIGSALVGNIEGQVTEQIGELQTKATEEISKVIEANIPELGQFEALGGGELPSIPISWIEFLEPIVMEIIGKNFDLGGGLFGGLFGGGGDEDNKGVKSKKGQ